MLQERFAASAKRGKLRLIGRTPMRSAGASRPSVLEVVVLIAAPITALVAWVRPLGSSLWLDETGTFWVIKGSFARAIDTGYRFHAQPLYYGVEWVWRRAFGSEEWILRIPSVIFMSLAGVLLYLLAKRLFDARTGILAVLAFLSIRDVAFAAADARPYAFALAATMAATLVLVRWMSDPSLGAAASYALLMGLVLHLHYLFGLMLVAHLFYVARRRQAVRIPTAQYVVAVGILGLVTIPALSGLIDFASRRETLESTSSVRPIAILIVPAIVLLLYGMLSSFVAGSIKAGFRNGSVMFVAFWAIVPPALLFLTTLMFGANVFQARYALVAAPGLALLIGATLRLIEPRVVATVIAGLLTVTTMASMARSSDHWVEDWQRATQFIQSASSHEPPVILVRAGLVESQNIDWLRDPERREYLTAPLSYYRVPGTIVPLPYARDAAGAVEYLEQVTQSLIGRGRPVMVVTNYSHELDLWFRDRLGPTLVAFDSRTFGVIRVTLFAQSNE